ncbi:hypothetical protein Fmac_008274 [Flemingia macrophylla]|uniref:DUF7745 domain-containing protein n=1 Tax=Flemingia macrophylla TaxID=520843 RepID=A0ABD1MX08_9FABA
MEWKAELEHWNIDHFSWIFPWFRPSDILIRCGDYPSVPLMGLRGCIAYSPKVAMRQIMRAQTEPSQEELGGLYFFHEFVNLEELHAICKAWEKPVYIGDRELGKSQASVSIDYEEWRKRRGVPQPSTSLAPASADSELQGKVDALTKKLEIIGAQLRALEDKEQESSLIIDGLQRQCKKKDQEIEQLKNDFYKEKAKEAQSNCDHMSQAVHQQAEALARHVGEAEEEWNRHIDPLLEINKKKGLIDALFTSRMERTPFVIKSTSKATPQDDRKPQPLVIHINKEKGPVAPLRILMPSPFPYASNKAVPWRYEVHTSLNEDISNIAEIGGMTRSGRVYSPKDMQDKAPKEKEPRETEEKEEESKDEADELLKFIRQSEYSIVDQLNRTPAMITLLSLIMSSEPHRKALLKVLNEAYVSHNISQDKFEGIVGNITANDHLTFTDEEIPPERPNHNNPLHISVKYKEYLIAKVLVDNGSSLNVMPKRTSIK